MFLCEDIFFFSVFHENGKNSGVPTPNFRGTYPQMYFWMIQTMFKNKFKKVGNGAQIGRPPPYGKIPGGLLKTTVEVVHLVGSPKALKMAKLAFTPLGIWGKLAQFLYAASMILLLSILFVNFPLAHNILRCSRCSAIFSYHFGKCHHFFLYFVKVCF